MAETKVANNGPHEHPTNTLPFQPPVQQSAMPAGRRPQYAMPPTNLPHLEHFERMRPQARMDGPLVIKPPPPQPRRPEEPRQKPKQRLGKYAPEVQEAEESSFSELRQNDSTVDNGPDPDPDPKAVQAEVADCDVTMPLQQDQLQEELSQLDQLRQLSDESIALSRQLRYQNRELAEEHSRCGHNAAGAFIGGLVVGMAAFMVVDRWAGWLVGRLDEVR